MSKVGILSMQRIINYGSFLQAYALKTILEEQGHEVEFVDYRVGQPLLASNQQVHSKYSRLLSKTIEVLKYNASLKQKIQFIEYKHKFAAKYFHFLGISDAVNYTPSLDVLVIGSDEVFNCIQQNKNVGYSLELFGKNSNAKKVISYAASFGNTTIEKLKEFHKEKEIGGLLNKFSAISVRDNNSGEIVEQITSKHPVYNLDPVLTYDYMNKCQYIPQKKIAEAYLILYAYSGRISDEEATWIKSYAQKKNLKIYAIGGIQSCADKFIDCSPFEVLNYFSQAQEIITDTFHGTIFSIITKRKFTTLVRRSRGMSYGNEEKLTDLLKRVGLMERMTYQIAEVAKINVEPIDYQKVNLYLNNERKNALMYLRKEIE